MLLHAIQCYAVDKYMFASFNFKSIYGRDIYRCILLARKVIAFVFEFSSSLATTATPTTKTETETTVFQYLYLARVSNQQIIIILGNIG